jgi:hypothetical protein
MQTYQLREAIVAVSRDARSRTSIFTLAAGSVLTLKNAALDSGLVDAEWQGSIISVFVQDLKARADLTRSIST